jgi:hypothetical protein
MEVGVGVAIQVALPLWKVARSAIAASMVTSFHSSPFETCHLSLTYLCVDPAFNFSRS